MLRVALWVQDSLQNAQTCMRLVKKDGSDLDLFEKVPADIGVDQDTMLTVVVDEMPKAPAPLQSSLIFCGVFARTPCNAAWVSVIAPDVS